MGLVTYPWRTAIRVLASVGTDVTTIDPTEIANTASIRAIRGLLHVVSPNLLGRQNQYGPSVGASGMKSSEAVARLGVFRHSKRELTIRGPVLKLLAKAVMTPRALVLTITLNCQVMYLQ